MTASSRHPQYTRLGRDEKGSRSPFRRSSLSWNTVLVIVGAVQMTFEAWFAARHPADSYRWRNFRAPLGRGRVHCAVHRALSQGTDRRAGRSRDSRSHRRQGVVGQPGQAAGVSSSRRIERGQADAGVARPDPRQLRHDALEDRYLPYKQKRKTKAVIAREAGLQPLADWLWDCGHGSSRPRSGKHPTATPARSAIRKRAWPTWTPP